MYTYVYMYIYLYIICINVYIYIYIYTHTTLDTTRYASTVPLIPLGASTGALG